MSKTGNTKIRLRVEPTNPGQFFACCGLLELADRLWDGAEGWFGEEPSRGQETFFYLRPLHNAAERAGTSLIDELARCHLTNTMTDREVERRSDLGAMSKNAREAVPALKAEKESLDKSWREAPLRLMTPFNLRIDWFLDERAGGSTFKTWAGQQSVLDIARGMKAPIERGGWRETDPEDWLGQSEPSDSLPFNFDSVLGGMGSACDVGFSLDPLGLQVRSHPLVELAALIGLQRFRPAKVARNRFRFLIWSDPLVPQIAAAAASGQLELRGSRAFHFQLLYRTKYLKSFLPAHPTGVSQ